MKYCFVLGCERSGTTALVRLLQSHPSIAMGMERYKYLVRRMRIEKCATPLSPAHFEAERFFDFRLADTNIIPPHFARHYETTRKRFAAGRLAYVGDKIQPADTRLLLRLAKAFPTARFVFVYRDLLDVASSFEVRARDASDTRWPAENGYRRAFEHWMAAFAAVEALIDRRRAPVGVVRYEELFGGDDAAAVGLFGFLDLEVEPSVVDFLAVCTATWTNGRARPLALGSDQQRELRRRVDWDVVSRFDALAAGHLPTTSVLTPDLAR